MSSSSNQKVNELNVFIDDRSSPKNKDCLACKLTGSIGLFLISGYIYYHGRKQSSRLNRFFYNSLGTGKCFCFL